MSEQKDRQSEQKYSVDEILAEFSSRSKVVDFPDLPKEEGDLPSNAELPVRPGKKSRPAAPVEEIRPETPARHAAARLSSLVRRAIHYADHMYDRAEPDPETLRAEKYIPGVDREEAPPETPVRRRRTYRPAEVPPDVPAADLAARWQKGLKGRGRRSALAFLLAVLSVPLSLDLTSGLPFGLTLPAGFPADLYGLQCLILAGLLVAAGALCWDVLWQGLRSVVRFSFSAEILVLLAWLFTLADSLTAGKFENRQGCLPCGAVVLFGLAFHLWGMQANRRAARITAKTAAQARTPYIVTLDDNKWSGRPAYTKWSGSPLGFSSQLQMPDAGQTVYRIAAPLLVLAGLLCAVMASVGQGVPGRFLWAASAIFTAVSSWSALLAYGLPFKKLARRLSGSAALAGWPGVHRAHPGGIVTTDGDLFPPGTVKVIQVTMFGGVATEKAVAYAATLLRVMNCGLTRPFHDLLRTHGAFYREVSGVRPHEGGISGIIRNQDVLVGTASFMHLMEVPLPPGLNVKNALFCALDGQLAGMFLLEYRLSTEVNPALSALMHADVSPILATRDFNLIPSLLGQRFRLPMDRMEFPPVERRLELSRDEQEHDDTPVALLCREGLSVFSDAVVGARRLRTAAKLSLIFAVAGAVVGLVITFFLTAGGAYTSLTTPVFLAFMALWLVPEILIANWVNQF